MLVAKQGSEWFGVVVLIHMAETMYKYYAEVLILLKAHFAYSAILIACLD